MINVILMILMIRKPKATWFPETVVSPFEDPRYKKIQAIIHYRNESPEQRSLVPLKQLVLQQEIQDTKTKYEISFTKEMDLQSKILKLLCSPETVGSPFGDPR